MRRKPDSALTKTSLEAVTAGKELAARLGASLAIGIVAGDCGAAAASSIAGTGARVLGVSGEAFAQARYASDAAACEALCKAAQATIVLAPGKFAVCARRSGRCASAGRMCGHTCHIRRAAKLRIEVSRWFYRQRIEAVITRDGATVVSSAGCRNTRAICGRVQRGSGGAVAVELPAVAHDRDRNARPCAECADDSSGGGDAVRRRGGMDEEAA